MDSKLQKATVCYSISAKNLGKPPTGHSVIFLTRYFETISKERYVVAISSFMSFFFSGAFLKQINVLEQEKFADLPSSST